MREETTAQVEAFSAGPWELIRGEKPHWNYFLPLNHSLQLLIKTNQIMSIQTTPTSQIVHKGALVHGSSILQWHPTQPNFRFSFDFPPSSFSCSLLSLPFFQMEEHQIKNLYIRILTTFPGRTTHGAFLPLDVPTIFHKYFATIIA